MNGQRTRTICAGLVLLTLNQVQLSAQEDNDLPLPRWTPQEVDAMRASPQRPLLLGDLLGSVDDLEEPTSNLPLLLGESNDVIGDSPEKSQPSADLSRFLLPSLLKSSRTHPAPEAAAPSTTALAEVSGEFLRKCEGAPATTRLIDPNHELSETAAEDFDRFLTFHASDSRIPFTLVILGRSQKLREGAGVARFASGSAASGSSALVVSPYGEPWRTRFFVSQPIRDAVPSGYLNSLLESCIRDAMRATDPDEQLHRLLVQLSIRLFWVQRMLAPVPETIRRGVVPAADPPVASLDEVISPAIRAPRWYSGWWNSTSYAMLAFILLGFYAFWRWHRFRMRHYQWLLPESPTAAQRFGGPSCGGGLHIRYR
ncbi:MAG: hypothetical protein JWO89_2529 [Verrucomicrobiaceae bacterium]|nr:hypothetical protein [Verrucomicrobiaceae bacterium]